MAAAPDLPGLSYDPANARAIADGLRSILAAAMTFNASTGDRLAGLAIEVARVIHQSHLAKNPGVGTAAVASMALQVATTGEFSDLLA